MSHLEKVRESLRLAQVQGNRYLIYGDEKRFIEELLDKEIKKQNETYKDLIGRMKEK